MIGAVRRIVVVDDNRDLLYTIRIYLTAHGHTVWTEDDGPAGVRRITSERPDIAFCDLNLPGLDGYRLARSVRNNSGLAEIRLIATTADSEQACSNRALAAGFETILVKPVPLVEMLQVVETPRYFPNRDSGLASESSKSHLTKSQ